MSNDRSAEPGSPEPGWRHVVRWMLALGAGAAFYAWGGRSVVDGAVVAWYVAETMAQLYAPQRAVLAVYLLPRAVGTAAGLAIAALWAPGWVRPIPLTYLVVVALEGAAQVALRWTRPALLSQARAALRCDRPRLQGGAAPGPVVGRVFAAWAFVLLAIPTLYAHGLRDVAADARTYATQFEALGLHDLILDMGGDLLLDAARGQGGEARRAVALLSEEDARLGAQIALPKAWVTAFLERTARVTLTWVQEGAGEGVPPIAIPVADLQRHVSEAVSALSDRAIARLPRCEAQLARGALCRPEGWSVAAHTATFKPQALAAVDAAFELIPAELDLSTAVTMSPRTFAGPLEALARAGAVVERVDRALFWARVGCLLATLAVLYASADSALAVLRWGGGALLVAGGGLWIASWSTAVLGVRSVPVYAATRALSDLDSEGVALLARALSATLGAVHRRISLLAVLAAACGALLALAGSALQPTARGGPNPGQQRQRWEGARAGRTLVIALALGALLSDGYLWLGERTSDRATAAYRAGDLAAARAGYRVVEWAYPLAVRPYVERARQALGACERYSRAAEARAAGDYERAADLYASVLVGEPPIAVRTLVEGEWVASLTAWASALRAEGDLERALDRYRTVRDGARAREASTEAQRQMAELYLVWGDALQAEGDYRAAAATYARVRDEVAQPRAWLAAEERQVDAFCAWASALRQEDDAVQAAQVCQALREAFPNASACPACE
ncbi:MAG: hypothetical protein JXA09_16035 [Anaerolineae bacterium]|nr:hypothetical protein [Anaerolineae bacterium]